MTNRSLVASSIVSRGGHVQIDRDTPEYTFLPNKFVCPGILLFHSMSEKRSNVDVLLVFRQKNSKRIQASFDTVNGEILRLRAKRDFDIFILLQTSRDMPVMDNVPPINGVYLFECLPPSQVSTALAFRFSPDV